MKIDAHHRSCSLYANTHTRWHVHAQFLDFGDVETYEWADQLVTFSNANTLLPVVFQAPKSSPYFDIQPDTGLIHGGHEQQVCACPCLCVMCAYTRPVRPP